MILDLDCRILLAEDALDTQKKVIVHVLRKTGAEVSAAENGLVAVDLALAAKQAGKAFDIILMDMQMPVLDGHEATRQLRKAGYVNPIIALTANTTTENRQKCLDGRGLENDGIFGLADDRSEGLCGVDASGRA
jgi:CheY-like chemotaxis protein